MNIVKIEDHRRIYEDQQIIEVLSRSINRATEGKIKSAAESIYSKQQGRFYIAMEDEQVVGILGIKIPTGKDSELIHLAVREGFENKGIASELIREAVRLDGLKNMTVEGCSLDRGFFRKCGFRTVDRNYDDILMCHTFVCHM